MADLINIAFSDINLIDNILINELANISNDIFLNDKTFQRLILFISFRVFYNTKFNTIKALIKAEYL